MIKTKILHYVDENRLAWAESWIQLIRELESKGLTNQVVCKSGGTLTDRLHEAGLPFETYNIPISWLPQTGLKLGGIISAFSPDIIHTRLSSAARIGGFWAKKTGIPVIETVDKYPKAHYHKNADHLITCSESVKRHMIKLGYPETMISTVFNPVDPKKYVFDKDKAIYVRDMLGILPNEKVILGAGNFVEMKGFDNLIKAFQLLILDSRQDLKLLLLGEGEEKDTLCKLIKSSGLGKKVIMPGFVQDIRPYMWASDIFVLSSKKPEPFGVVLIEAMASGLASIATKAGGPIDIIKDGVNGCLVEINSAKDIAKKIKLLLEDDNLKNKIAVEGIETVSKNFNVKDIALKHIEIYKKIILLNY